MALAAPVLQLAPAVPIDHAQLLQSLPLPVLALDPANLIVHANAAAAQFLGVAATGRPLADFLPD